MLEGAWCHGTDSTGNWVTERGTETPVAFRTLPAQPGVVDRIEALPVLLHIDMHEPVEISEHLRPLFVDARGLEAVLQGFPKDERHAGTEDVAPARLVSFVPDRPC